MRLIVRILWNALLVAMGILIIQAFAAVLEVAWFFGFGWALFMFDILPSVTINPEGVWTALICLPMLILGLHWFLRWLAGSRAAVGTNEPPAQRWPLRWTMSIVAVVVVMFIAGIAGVGLVHQTIWLFTATRPLTENGFHDAVARIKSSNNLRQIALAAHNYKDIHQDFFPPGGLFDEKGKGLHGWATLLLPYMEQEKLYQSINLKIAWNDPANAHCFKKPFKEFCHPLIDQIQDANGYGLMHYAANVRLIGGERSLGAKDVMDGLGNTLLFGEVNSNFKPWGHPANWRDPALGLDESLEGFGSPLKEGVDFAFADGSARVISRDISKEVLKALSTPAGGEPIDRDKVP